LHRLNFFGHFRARKCAYTLPGIGRELDMHVLVLNFYANSRKPFYARDVGI